MTAALLLFPLALAQAAPDRPTEEEMFGGPPAPEPATAPASASPGGEQAGATAAPGSQAPPPDADTAQLEAASRSTADLRAEVEEDKLEIGGDLLLRFQSTFATKTDALDQGFSAPGLLDIYLDARPSERLRAYAEGRLTYDPTLENGRADLPDFCTPTDSMGNPSTDGLTPEQEQTLTDCQSGRDALAKALATPAETSGLTQLWLKFDAAQSVFFTLGRQPVKWGAAHLWNPTDFLNAQARDPLSQIDLRTGVSLVKLHIPWESQTANFYAIGILDGAKTVGDVGGAARAEIALGAAEASVSAAGRRDRPLLLGADLSLGVWQFDLYAEGAVSHGHHQPLPGEPDRSEDWIPRVAGGLSMDVNYGDEDTFTWGLEYTFNDDGVDDPKQFGAALQAGRSFFALPRQAAGGYVVVMAPGRLDDSSIFLTGLVSLDDISGTARLQWSERVLTWLSVQPYLGMYFGDAGDLFKVNLNALSADATATPAYLTAEAGVWLALRI